MVVTPAALVIDAAAGDGVDELAPPGVVVEELPLVPVELSPE
jgi:hypothetical protein